MANKIRLKYLDNLKVFLIMLVIVHHVGQAYGPTGGFWPYHGSAEEAIPWLHYFFPVNAAFFMGLFFMISGYFFPASLDHKGAIKFLKDKFIRFGIPLAFALLVMIPALMYVNYLNYSGNPHLSYFTYFIKIFLGIGGKPLGFNESIGIFPEWNFGPLWFVEHLLVYAVLYTIFRQLFKNFTLGEAKQKPGFLLILCIGALIALGCSVMRIWYPIDKWVRLFGFIQTELAHLPQYVVMFTTGIIASRKQWFEMMDKSKGLVVFAAGIFMATIIYFLPILPPLFAKIVHTAIYESFMAVLISWGLIVFFREFCEGSGTTMQWLAENSYAAYIFHFPIVVAIQYAMSGVTLGGAWSKFILASVISISLTYAFCGMLRKISVIRKVI